MKNKKVLLIALLILVFFIIRYFYLSVNGSEISAYLTSEDISRIKVAKSHYYSNKIDIVANDQQEKLLIDLLNETKFKKILSSGVLFKDQDRYFITGENSKGQSVFSLESYGGEFVIIDFSDGKSTPKHWKLRIKNDKWKEQIENIITMTN